MTLEEEKKLLKEVLKLIDDEPDLEVALSKL